MPGNPWLRHVPAVGRETALPLSVVPRSMAVRQPYDRGRRGRQPMAQLTDLPGRPAWPDEVALLRVNPAPVRRVQRRDAAGASP